MINKLIKIEQGGIFENYSPQGLPDFKRYNLFYGWNGSGKSTLAKIFWHLETKQKLEHLDNLKYQFEFDGTKIDNSTKDLPCKLFVFNAQFIRDNTDFVKGSASSIAYIGKEKVDLKKEIDILSEELLKKKEELQKSDQSCKQAAKRIDDHFISCGKALRDLHSKTIYSTDDITKTNASRIWNEVISKGSSYDDYILSNELLSQHHNVIRQGEERKTIPLMNITVSLDEYKRLQEEYQEILWSNPVSNSVERLANFPEIQAWVYQGLQVHSKYKALKCEYCDQAIPAERKQKLNDHFNNEFIKLQNNIDDLILRLKKLKITMPIYDPQKLFSRYIPQFGQYYYEISNDVKTINDRLDEWIDSLLIKKQNPLKRDFTINNINAGYVVGLSLELINGLISHHNASVESFMGEAQKSRAVLDHHLVATKSRDANLLELMEDEDLAQKELIRRNVEIDILNKKVAKLRIDLADDTLVLANMNNDLHKFMGRNEISLMKNNAGGYLIDRSGKLATNLSEGEKTAISLVYFVHKLDELENKLSNSIIVLDDPISSFDSNHLFNACSYIMNHCTGCKQFFLFTHNFWFFKLVRDWMQKRLINEYELFQVKRGQLFKAESALVKHHSEYHYIFSNVLGWSKSENIAWQENFSIANCCRRLLESFNAFKTPSTSSFNEILQKAVNKGFSKDLKDQIFFFLNKYSHLDRIEAIDGTIENIEGEGKKITANTLDLIKLLDQDHYESMVKLCEVK